MRPLLRAAALAVALAVPRAASAQASAPSPADALFTQAREKMHAGDYAAARPLLVESQRLDPAAGALLNIADCEEHTGDLAGAWAHWREAIAGLKPDDPALTVAKQRLEKLEARVPRLTVRLADGAPPGTRVLRDGMEMAPAGLGVAMVVAPGAHEVVVAAPGRMDRREAVSLGEGEAREVVVAAGAEAPRVVATPVVVVGPAVRPWGERHTKSLVLAGGGAALAGVGLGLAVKTLPDHAAWAKMCSATVCTEADGAGIRREALAANVLFGLAAGAGAAAVAVFFAAEGDKGAVKVSVVPMGAGAGVVVRY